MMHDIMKEYDFIISLGRFCRTSDILNANGLKIVDGPYDWSGTAHKETIYNRIEWFYKGFENYFDKKDFIKFATPADKADLYQDWYCDAVRHGRTSKKQQQKIREGVEKFMKTDVCIGYYNTRTQTYYIHDWKMDEGFDSQFASIREKYLRRIRRTENYIRYSNSILFVYMNHLGDQHRDMPLESKEVVRVMNELRSKFPDKTIDLYMFDHDPSFNGERFRCDVLDVGIIRFVSNHDNVFPPKDKNPKHICDGMMMPKSVCYILSKIKLTDKHKLIMFKPQISEFKLFGILPLYKKKTDIKGSTRKTQVYLLGVQVIRKIETPSQKNIRFLGIPV
jgi:hypothetical protein